MLTLSCIISQNVQSFFKKQHLLQVNLEHIQHINLVFEQTVVCWKTEFLYCVRRVSYLAKVPPEWRYV